MKERVCPSTTILVSFDNNWHASSSLDLYGIPALQQFKIAVYSTCNVNTLHIATTPHHVRKCTASGHLNVHVCTKP